MTSGPNNSALILQFVEEISLTNFAASGFDVNSDLFENGIIDSFGFIEIIAFLERDFGVKFHDDDFLDKRFSTISGIAELVESARARAHVASGGE